MGKTILILTVFTMFIVKTSAQVTIYQGKNFTGKSHKFTSAEGYDVTAVLGTDKIGSIEITPGWSAKLYDSYSDDAGKLKFTSSAKDLSKEFSSKSIAFVYVEHDEATKETVSKNTLISGEILATEKDLISENGTFILRMQKDGHLCVYRFDNGKQGAFVWGSGKHGFSNANLILQEDGNLVVYDGNKTPKWNSGTHPYHNEKFKNQQNKPVKLVLENDGSLKLYAASNTVVWSNK